ncbi:MAG: LysE family translocator [Reyranella sp.]|uniref:LysE family translocator n=1 Tax=Reyranella sp. TaxID=1929291 RepID=UPI002731C837|nr:LysE family translocator [Reyranella sp.]MDP1962568.1 LysE family translocator [Reyranella sp.]MDP2372996.1 LysE family translocator [Reyranella sp.]
MDYALVLISVFAIFIPALILPGPDFVAVVRSSMTYGTRAGLLTTLGVSLGLCLYATLSLLGLSAILVQYQWLTWAVRVLGGSYLIFLGIKLLRARPQEIDLDQASPPSRHRAVLFGFLVTLTNPKAIVLFASVFATAVTASTPAWLMGLMIGLVTASSLTWYSCVSLFMSSGPVMRRFQRARHWIERAAGLCFIGLGGKVLADAGRPISS